MLEDSRPFVQPLAEHSGMVTALIEKVTLPPWLSTPGLLSVIALHPTLVGLHFSLLLSFTTAVTHMQNTKDLNCIHSQNPFASHKSLLNVEVYNLSVLLYICTVSPITEDEERFPWFLFNSQKLKAILNML